MSGGEVRDVTPVSSSPAAPWYARYSKLIAGFLGTLTPQAVFTLLEQGGVHLNPWIDLGVTTVFAAVAIWRAPRNRA